MGKFYKRKRRGSDEARDDEKPVPAAGWRPFKPGELDECMRAIRYREGQLDEAMRRCRIQAGEMERLLEEYEPGA